MNTNPLRSRLRARTWWGRGRLAAALFAAAAHLAVASTIDATNRFAWAANAGWIDWRVADTQGAVVGEFVCSGYLYAANVGWVHLGSGTPANGIQYQNNSATDYGVNLDSQGGLRGLAWAPNVGWISFTNRDAGGHLLAESPRVDLLTGRLSGYLYSPNLGWISLSNATAFVQTLHIASGSDTDADGLADAWELQQVGTLTTMNATSNLDGDGATDLEEHLADTDPLLDDDELRITHYTFASSPGAASITWKSRPTRFYYLQKQSALGLDLPWTDSGLGLITPVGETTTRSVPDDASAQSYWRLQVVRPLD